jgi:hypothetical protein
MKTLKFGVLLLLASGLLPATLASAQSYSLDWFTVAGGGGASTGGVFAVSGTIGQADAGTLTGGNFTLTGGYWAVIAAIQTPGLPYLWVSRTPTNTVCVSWELADSTWTLQTTTNLAAKPIVWATVPPPYQTNATSAYYVEPTPRGNKFYRLFSPPPQ